MAMNIQQWAIKWGIPYAALADLAASVENLSPDPDPTQTASEAWAQSQVRLEASQKGARVWRNNVGVLTDKTGRPVRYGLANDSKQVNEKIKSGDLIGIRPVLITQAHVGTVIGQFLSREIKAPNWQYTGTSREVAQLEWARVVNALGGDAKFATGAGTI